MPPRRRAYKLSLAAFVVITGVWMASSRVAVMYSTGTTAFGIIGGAVSGLFDTQRFSPSGFHYVVLPLNPTTPSRLERIPEWWLEIPLWCPALLAAVATIVFWHRSRRIPAGRCKACRYDLTGLPEPRCPACGEAI